MPSMTATILPFEVGRRKSRIDANEKQHFSRFKQLSKKWSVGPMVRGKANPDAAKSPDSLESPLEPETELDLNPKTNSILSGKYTFTPEPCAGTSHVENAIYSHEQRISQELKATVESIAYIAEHMKGRFTQKILNYCENM